jgi:tetratricopeptide (TPR) repeat protein
MTQSTTSVIETKRAAETVSTVWLLNVPLLIGTLGVAALLALGGFFWHGYQLDRIATDFLARADELRGKSDWRGAADYVFRYLQLRPDDAPARIRLARDYGRSVTSATSRARAIDLYYQALGVASEMDRRELRRSLAELLLKQGRYVEAEKEADLLIRTDPQDASTRRTLALAMYGQFQAGQLAEHRGAMRVGEACQQAVTANPQDVELALLLASVLREQPDLLGEEQRRLLPTQADRDRKASQVMDQMVSANPREASAYLARFRYRSLYQLAGAEDDLEAALRIGSDRADVALAAAGYYHQQAQVARHKRASAEDVKRNHDQALKYYRQVVDRLQPDNVAAYLGLGELFRSQGETDQAIQVVRQGLERVGSSNIPMNLRLAEALIAAKRVSEAEVVLRQVAQARSQTGRLSKDKVGLEWDRRRDVLEAEVRVLKGEPLQAIALLKPLVVSGLATSAERLRAWLLLGDSHTALGDWDQAATAYETAVGLDVKQAQVRLAAAEAWLKAGQPHRAVRLVEPLLAEHLSLDLSLTLARVWMVYQATLPIGRRDWTPVERLVSQFAADGERQDLSDPWRVELLLADFALVRGRETGATDRGAASALKALRAAEQQHPKAARLWPELASRYEQMGQPSDADRALAQGLRPDNRSRSAYLLASAICVGRKDYAGARKVLGEGLAALPQADHPDLRVGLAQVSLAEGKSDAAERELAQAHQEQPSNVGVIRLLANLALDAGNRAAAKRWEDKLRGLEGGDGTSWQYARARRLLQEVRDTAAPAFQEVVSLQAGLQRQRPSWSAPYVLKGLIEELQRQEEQAIEAYQTALRLGEKRLFVYKRLVMLLYRQSRFAEADECMAQLGAPVLSSPSFSPLAISVAAALQDVPRAQTLAEQATKDRPTDPTAWVWYGQVLALNQQPEQAEQAFRKAIEVAPQDGRAYSAMFGHQLRAGQGEQARETLEQLSKQVPLGDAERAFILAQGYDLLGDAEQADAQYRAAAKLSPDNVVVHARLAGFLMRRDSRQAEVALRRVMELARQGDSHRALGDNARRALAALLATRGGDGDFEEAVRLLQQAGDEQHMEDLDERLQAVLLMQRKGPDLGRAQQLLEDLVFNRRTGVDGDHLLLAGLYAKQSETLTGDQQKAKRDAARKQYEVLCLRPKPNPSHLVAYLGFLMDLKQWSDADQVLLRLEELAADDVRTVVLRMYWLSRQGRTSEVQPLIEAYGQRIESQADNDSRRAEACASVGQIYSQLGLHAAAEVWYRKAVVIEPPRFGLLANALLGQGKTSEAIQLCLTAARKDPESPRAATTLADVLAAVLALGRAGKDDIQMAQPILAKAVTDHPADPDLLLAVANVCVLQGRNEEAIQLYQQVLHLNPRNGVAMNNLASLLAEQPGKAQEALRYIDQAIQIDGSRVELLDTKGMILVHQGRPADAVDLLEQAAATEGADPRFGFHLAVALQQVGETGKARTALEAALNNNLRKQFLTETDNKLLAELERLLLPTKGTESQASGK